MSEHTPPSSTLSSPAAPDGPRRVSRRGHRRTRRKALIAVVIALIALGGISAGAVYGLDTIYDRLTEGTADFAGPPTGEQVVRIAAGSSIRAIGSELEENGVVETEGAFVAAARDDSRASTLQPGTYRLQQNMPAAQALALLLDPSSRILARIAVPEGLTVDETVAKLAKESGLPGGDFRDALAKPGSIGLPEWAKGQPEGFLFPATYDVEPDATAASVLEQITERFALAAVETDILARAAEVGLSPFKVLTVASLVQAEAKLAEDMPKVARVIYNRLDAEMLLQFDSTVHFANGGAETITTSDAERDIDSPYNTYKFPGLPPGPIQSPGQAAIEAALMPAVGDWLFFVSVNPDTGETKFAVTGAEHARNVAEFRRWLAAN